MLEENSEKKNEKQTKSLEDRLGGATSFMLYGAGIGAGCYGVQELCKGFGHVATGVDMLRSGEGW